MFLYLILRVYWFNICIVQYYESLLVEARNKVESSISEAVDKAVNSKMKDIQNKFDKCVEEKSCVSDVSF